jgi:hypothetical protein
MVGKRATFDDETWAAINLRRGKRAMISRAFGAAVFGVVSLAILSPAKAQYTEGTCGGVMTGYNGRGYTCGPDRKPVCEQSTGRCVCLLRTDCGAKRNENF